MVGIELRGDYSAGDLRALAREWSDAKRARRLMALAGVANGLSRTEGTRPRQAADQRYENAYIFGAVCPALDKGAALVMPHANAEAMQKHLEEITSQSPPRPWRCHHGRCGLAQVRRTEHP
ncbi:hypothetical protein [Profundibacter sp.]